MVSPNNFFRVIPMHNDSHARPNACFRPPQSHPHRWSGALPPHSDVSHGNSQELGLGELVTEIPESIAAVSAVSAAAAAAAAFSPPGESHFSGHYLKLSSVCEA